MPPGSSQAGAGGHLSSATGSTKIAYHLIAIRAGNPAMETRFIALITHNRQKQDLIAFVPPCTWPSSARSGWWRRARPGRCSRRNNGAGGRAGRPPAERGDLMIGARVAEGKIIALIFFRDPLTAQPHEPDVSTLMRVCDVHRVPLATNRGTAEAIIEWLSRSSRRCLLASSPESPGIGWRSGLPDERCRIMI